MAEKRNSEGYWDPTAYQALRNIEKAERSKRKRMKRGEIYYIAPIVQRGSEQKGGRPAIIVSNDKCNDHSSVIEVVYLTTKEKSDLPTHVTIRSSERESTALCEQITPVAKDRVGDYKGKLTDTEMLNVEIAMLIGLGIDMPKQKVVEIPVEKVVEVIKEVPVPVEQDGGGGQHRVKRKPRRHDRQMRNAPDHVRFSAVPNYWRQRRLIGGTA